MWKCVSISPLSVGLLLACCVALAAPAIAGDLSSDIRKGAAGRDEGDGGYIEIGVGVASYTSPIVGQPEGNEQGEIHTEPYLDINARYQYRGLFVEVFSQSLEQITLGYMFYQGDNWALDWVGLAQHDEMSTEQSWEYRSLNRRRGDFMSGPRATIYVGNNIVQFHALTDVSHTHGGESYSLKLARYWQYRNWTLHGIVGATYRSSDIVDYYFGIDESEASEKYPVYSASSEMAYVTEVGVTYPISEKWVFRSFIRRIDTGKGATQSPLILDDHGEMISSAISYVF